MNTMKNKDRALIETALELDTQTLDDLEYLEQQNRVENHYQRAAELHYQHNTQLAQQHEQAAYEAAEYLRDMVVHDLNQGSTWGRIYNEMLEQWTTITRTEVSAME